MTLVVLVTTKQNGGRQPVCLRADLHVGKRLSPQDKCVIYASPTIPTSQAKGNQPPLSTSPPTVPLLLGWHPVFLLTLPLLPNLPLPRRQLAPYKIN